MHQVPLLILAVAVFFLLVWCLVGWLKFREHHHIIHHEPREKTHITHFFRRRPKSSRPKTHN